MEWEILESKKYQEIMEDYKISSLLAKYIDAKSIDYELYSLKDVSLHDYFLLNDASKILERINKAIKDQEKVVIYGDYDCDGIMATTILVSAFERLGLNVGYHIPNRFIDGYGLNVERVKQMYEKGCSLIITVDNGIKAFEAIELANSFGIDVIITDHHDVGLDYPKAYGVLHTKLSVNYPFKEISGGLLAYKLATAMLGKGNAYLMSLAGLTTVSDMMPLWNENRTVVKLMLKFLNDYHFETFELLSNDTKNYNVQTLSFTVIPKINSIGRMVEKLNPNQCVKYFKNAFASSQADREFKMKFSSLVNQINLDRQELTNKQYEDVLTKIHENKKIIYVHGKEYHEGIIGLISSKLTREFNKPSFVLSYDHQKEVYKGSARSIDGFKLNELFEDFKEELVVYGGHELAGGFSITKERLTIFEECLIKRADEIFLDEDLNGLVEGVLIDEDDLTLDKVKELALLEPYGMKNEEPIFCIKDIKYSKIEALKNGEHLKLSFNLKHSKLQALFFYKGYRLKEVKNKEKVSLIGTISINKFRNTETIQFILSDII